MDNFYCYFVAVDLVIQGESTAGTAILSLCQKFCGGDRGRDLLFRIENIFVDIIKKCTLLDPSVHDLLSQEHNSHKVA